MTRKLAKILLAGAAALAVSTPAMAAHFKVLHVFKGGRDGGAPASALTPDGQGNFYGTTDLGGRKCQCGTVFRIGPDGAKTVVYAFKGGSDGANPFAGMTFGPDGALYGTTYAGGGSTNCIGTACGTVFRLTTDGKETVLYAFNSQSDGANPQAAPIVDAEGNVFGTTARGGDAFNGSLGHGTVYKISPNGQETVLHRFSDDGKDGFNPAGKLAMDSAGNLYGTTPFGGHNGAGTVFKVTPQGVESIIHGYKGNDGGNPSSDLMMDELGMLYGTTKTGGSGGSGTVFRMATDGTQTVLYSFNAAGGYPLGGVIADGAGNLYGTLTYSLGGVYKLTPDGTFSTLYAFDGGKGGSDPRTTLATDGLGFLYGVASEGGSHKRADCVTYGCGTVFRVPE